MDIILPITSLICLRSTIFLKHLNLTHQKRSKLAFGYQTHDCHQVATQVANIAVEFMHNNYRLILLFFFFNIFLLLFFLMLFLSAYIIFMYVCMYVCMAVLGLRFCARAFSSCGKRGPLIIAVRRPLTIAASHCRAQAPDAQAQ